MKFFILCLVLCIFMAFASMLVYEGHWITGLIFALLVLLATKVKA